MSEIDPKFIKIQHPGTTAGEDSHLKKPGSGDNIFQRLLDRQTGKGADNTVNAENPSLPELTGTFNAQKLSPAPDTGLFARKMEKSVNLLETYAEWLSDPEKSLKQTRGLLEQLVSQTHMLSKEFESLSSADADLAELLSQLRTTVEVEQIKFNRGDYL